MTAKKALICGISGQDGAYLAELLLRKGYEVTGTSRDAQTASFRNLEALGIRNQLACESMALNDFRSVLQVCDDCQRTGHYLFKPLGLENHKLGDLVDAASRQRAKGLAAEVPLAQIPEFRLDGVAVGEHAYAGALRYFGVFSEWCG